MNSEQIEDAARAETASMRELLDAVKARPELADRVEGFEAILRGHLDRDDVFNSDLALATRAGLGHDPLRLFEIAWKRATLDDRIRGARAIIRGLTDHHHLTPNEDA